MVESITKEAVHVEKGRSPEGQNVYSEIAEALKVNIQVPRIYTPQQQERLTQLSKS